MYRDRIVNIGNNNVQCKPVTTIMYTNTRINCTEFVCIGNKPPIPFVSRNAINIVKCSNADTISARTVSERPITKPQTRSANYINSGLRPSSRSDVPVHGNPNTDCNELAPPAPGYGNNLLLHCTRCVTKRNLIL